MALSQAKLMAFRNSRTQGAIGLVVLPKIDRPDRAEPD